MPTPADNTDSSVPSATYTITGTVSAPSFSPGPATYTAAQSVTVTSATSGATIRYTTDGSTPTSSTGTVYTGPVSIGTSTTLKAIAYRASWIDSSTTTGAYTLAVTAPSFSPAAGTYTTAQSITLSSPTSGVSIRYTTDGSTPTSTTGTLYSGPFTVSASATVKAIAYRSGWTDSAPTSAAYTITGTVATPTFSPVPGTYTTGQSVAISTTTSGASIRYTTDGSTPTSTTGNLYSGPVAVNSSQTLTAIAYKAAWIDSAVASSTYTITGTVAQPAISPAPGSYILSQAITLSTTTSGASIRYTTDGSTPSSTAGIVYTAPFTLTASATVKAIAYRATWADSPVASGQYTIITPPPAVTLTTPANGATNQPVSVAFSWNAAAGATSYDVYLGTRTPVFAANVAGTSYSPTLTPGYTYSWYVIARNAAGAGSASATWTFTTALGPLSTFDGRRTGVKATGAYWGAAGEQIDLLSGNLNYAVPLLSAQTRGGVKLPFALSYNSQLWRETSAFAWKLGRDVGYGFGWILQAGSLLPLGNTYIFTDPTGAEYKLDQFANGVWTSSDGTYISYVELTSQLYFPDGTVWIMNAQSASGEADAGTRYPTLIQDTNGNQIRIDYAQGSGGSGMNSSARITRIQDSRMWSANGASYLFYYNADPTPHLIEIAPMITTPERYTFTYQAGQTLTSPGGATGFGTASFLQEVKVKDLPIVHAFKYAATAELTEFTTPGGGTLKWEYATQTYSSGQKFREVRVRKMKASPGDDENTWNITPANDPALNLHPSITVADVGANSQKYWRFTTTAGPYLGLANRYEERNGAGSAIHRKDYTWTQGPALNPYVASVITTLDPGTASQLYSKSTQTLDAYGNIANSKIYDYATLLSPEGNLLKPDGSLAAPARTYEYTYLHESNTNYAPRFIRNRVSEVYLTDRALPRARILWKRYDINPLSYPQDSPAMLSQQVNAPLHDDANFGTGVQYRGNVTYTWEQAAEVSYWFATTGVITSVTNGAGVQVSAGTTSNTGYSLPETLTPGGNSSLATAISYNSGWAVTTVTGANGANSTTDYDTYGRPTSSKVPDGATTNYTYTYNPDTQTATMNGRWTKTTLDGFGRTIRVETGNAEGTFSVVDTKYAPCACSPLGKLKGTSRPHTGAPVDWTEYTYDASGRTLTVTLPGGNVTTYLYTGNTTKVTDPAGKWKKHTSDVFGNLVTVTEPAPTGGEWTTTYEYDGFNHLAKVRMPRPYNGVSYEQTRTFTWAGNLMMSETNPETGQILYNYDRAGRMVSRIDAKHQKRGFEYDQYGRLSAKRYYRCDLNNTNCVEDADAAIVYYYDANPFVANRSQNAWGRLAAVEFRVPAVGWGNTIPMRYHYSYNQAGRVTNQWAQLLAMVDWTPQNTEFDATYTWDNEGRMTSQQGPWGASVESYTYDAMGRLSTGGATYYPSGQLHTFNGVTRDYNNLGQLVHMKKTGVMDIEYIYAEQGNNGRITQAKDNITGETVTYQYDSLNRLMQAETADSLWGTTYSYDGWGNLTSKAKTKGNPPTFSQAYDPALNMAVGSNVPSYVPPGYSENFDMEDRRKTGLAEFTTMVNTNSLASGKLGYDPSGKKVFWVDPTPDGILPAAKCEIYFLGITGQRIAQFGCGVSVGDGGTPGWSAWISKRKTHIGGQLTAETDYPNPLTPTDREITTDRLGSIRARGTERYTYYPYGEVRTATGTSSLYAALETPLRVYDSNSGRFDRPDPLGLGAVKMGDPGSWNRFAYVQGDPVNYVDPGGLLEAGADPCGPDWITDPSLQGPCNGGGGIGIGIGGGGGGSSFLGPNPNWKTQGQVLANVQAWDAAILAALVAAKARAEDEPAYRYVAFIRLTEDCYKSQVLGGSPVRRRRYQVVDNFGNPYSAGTLSITEHNYVQTGTLSAYGSTWIPDDNGEFDDFLSLGDQRGPTIEYQQFTATNTASLNAFANTPVQVFDATLPNGPWFGTLGINLSRTGVSINGDANKLPNCSTPDIKGMR